MTRIKSMHILRNKIQELVGGLEQTITLVDDHPILGEAALIGFFRDSLVDILGLSTQALDQINQPHLFTPGHLETKEMQISLVACQEKLHQIEARLYRELLSYPKIGDLLEFSRQTGGEWAGWANSVHRSLEDCWAKQLDMSRAVIACWQEVIE